MGGSTFGRKARIFKILAAYPAAISEAGEREKLTNTPPGGPGGDKGKFVFFNFN